MKITLEFDNHEEALDALNAPKYLTAIDAADSYLRNCMKHGDNTDEVEEILLHARRMLIWQE